jgi:hypothetical protein
MIVAYFISICVAFVAVFIVGILIGKEMYE